MQELSRDDADLDSPAKAFRQSVRIRDHARMLMETHTARERLRSAGKAQLHRDRNYHRGQWVYVWRRHLRGARDRTGGPSLSRWVGPGLVALQDGTTVSVSMRGRLWKCAREQIREATNHESLGAELLTHDHLRQLLTDARSPQTLTEAVDVSAEWTREEDRNREHHSEATSMENDVVQQSADMPHSDQDSKAQRSEVCSDNQTDPCIHHPGLQDSNHVTEHPTIPTTTITNHQNISRRPISGRQRAPSQTSTAAPLPLEDGSNRSLDLDTVSEGTAEIGFFREQAAKDIRISRNVIIRKRSVLLTPPRRCQVFQVKSHMLQSSRSIATECWILERRLAGGFIPNPSLRKNVLTHRKSILQAFWWERGTISFRTRQVHLSRRLWTERILHLREHTPLDTTSPQLDPLADTTMNPTVRWNTTCFWLAAAMKCIQSIFLLMSASPLR